MADAAPQPQPKWGDLGVRVASAAVLIPAVINYGTLNSRSTQ